ncbi:MAG: hypothetical protein HY903_22950 [Deltaproteobacteria bacterium]|nr:hypothetical protein [Deltaproteobacteria bacterium]
MLRKCIQGVLIAILTTGCVKRPGLGASAFAGPQQEPTAEEKKEEREKGAAGVEAAKAVSQSTQSAVVLTQQGNAMCFTIYAANFPGAQTAYREALKLEPKNAYVLAAQATCYARQGMEEKFSGKDGTASTDAKVLKRAERWFNRALGSARAALKVNETYGTAHLIIAEIYAMTNRPDKALETLNNIEAMKMIPEGRESGFYAWRSYVKSLLGQGWNDDLEAATEYHDPAEFAEYVDRLQNPEQYKDLPPIEAIVAPAP